MPHELRPDEIDRRERALREPKDSAVTGAIRGALSRGVRSTGTPITERTVIDASPLHTRRDLPAPTTPGPEAGATVAHAIRAATGTPIQKAKPAAKAQGAQGGEAAGGPTEAEDEDSKKPNRRPTKKRSTATKLAKIRLGEISGVDAAANDTKGWILAKSAGAAETFGDLIAKNRR